MKYGPDKNKAIPNENVPSVCFIKNVVTRPNIEIGDYTYYDDKNGAENFEAHVTHHYEFIGDKLIIGKFCQIASGIEFIMNGANHRMNSVTSYPFNIMGGGWEKVTPSLDDLPLKGDTVVGKRCLDRTERYCNARRTHRRRRCHRGKLRCHRRYPGLSHSRRQPMQDNTKKIR